MIYDKSSSQSATAGSTSSSQEVPTLAEIQALEELMSLWEEGATDGDDVPHSAESGIVALGVSPPPLLNQNHEIFQLSTNPNIWAFVQQITTAIDNMDLVHSCPSNLSIAHNKAHKSLQNHQGLVIKPADKGGNVVVMDVSFYKHMCRDILENRDW